MPPPKILVGQKYGRLTVLERAPNAVTGKSVKSMWLCQCDCGTTKIVQGSEMMRKGRPVQSCGCYGREQASLRTITHGKSTTPIYAVWRGILARCLRPDHYAYPDYGGRGITVCDKWKSFEGFYEDVGDPPFPRACLDRVDNDGPYSKENTRWATYKQQANNTRQNIRCTIFGREQTLAEWADEYGINRTTIYYRWNAGWRGEALLAKADFTNRQSVRPDECGAEPSVHDSGEEQ